MDDEERERHLNNLNEYFPPINFSIFPDLSLEFDRNIFDSISDFHDNNESTPRHIRNFTKAVVDFNVVHEVDLMYAFSCPLADDAFTWFREDVPINSISSLA